ncbi:hypothetical protein EVG20_g1876 [Dentipellis fragilis]|uniref:N-acetyltransferase domain-containing protein n=1 Tax=Dentipellis fragilis TaxID=205917 RepID=A0A4Y9Z8D1_9AGAM|nr:hypothetical protein EVG20_g1876 [Dentipellis fragilis]
MPPQYHPLQIHERTGEPYLRLPAPHSNIIITPLRTSDAPAMTEALNNPDVYQWLSGPPFPYLPTHAEWWIEHAQPVEAAVWKELQEGDADAPLKVVGSCPVSAIREQLNDGTEVYLGSADFRRHDYVDIVDLEERARLKAENDAKEVGDPTIIWSFGGECFSIRRSVHLPGHDLIYVPADWILPKVHGRGIMTAVMRTLIQEWGVPRMGIRHMLPYLFIGNVGSLRVFEKNGFVLAKTVEGIVDFPAKGAFPAETRSLHFMEWKADA